MFVCLFVCLFFLFVFFLLNSFFIFPSVARLRRACVAAGWTRRLLSLLAVDSAEPQLLALAQTLASAAAAPDDVRALLRLARTTLSIRRPAAWPLALGLLQSAAARQHGPSCFYDLSGHSSGLLLPPFAKLPSSGLSFCCWIRVEAFGRTSEPILLALCDDNDQGLIVKFSSNFLAISSQNAGKKAVCFSATFPFKTGQWYCVALTHEYHMIGSDQASLYVDGQMRGQFALPYPKNAAPLSRASIGCLKTDRRNVHTLVGQLGMVVFFEGVASSLFVKALYEAGPNMPQPQSEQMSLAKQTLTILATYSPRAAEGALCLETSRGLRGLHAMKNEGTAEVRQTDLAEAVVCVGGPTALLPLLAQLDLAVEGAELSAPAGAASDPADAAAVIELLQASLRHPLGAQAMLANHGFALMGHVLRCMSPSVWDARSFAALEGLSDALQGSEELHRSFYINIYLNFSIWVYAPVMVQRHVLSNMAKTVAGSKVGYFRKMITVQRILDGLRSYYAVSSSSTEVLKSVAGETLGERPRGGDLAALRALLLQIARSLMNGEPTIEETRALLLCLADDQDETADVAQLMLALLNEPSRVSTARHLLSAGGLGPLVSMAQRSDSVCIWAVKLIGKVLQVASEDKECLAMLQESREGQLLRLKSLVVSRKLTRDLYYVLLEVALECVDTAAVSNPLRPSEQQSVRNGVALSAVLELLCRDDRPAARQRALSDFLGLLAAGGRSNRMALVRQSGWEARVLAVLAMSRRDEGCYAVALDVASVLLQHCLLEGDFASVGRMYATLDLLTDGGHFGQGEEEGRAAARVLSERAAEQLAKEQHAVGQALRANATGALVECMVKWLELIEHECPPASLAGASSAAVLAETALLASGNSASAASAASSSSSFSSHVFGICIRLSLHAVNVAVRAMDSGNVARREERMSEIEALLLAGQGEVSQPMVDALAKFKSEKSKAWRAEEQLCGSMCATSGRRLAAVLPLFGRSGSESSAVIVSTVRWAALGVLDALKQMAALQVSVNKEGLQGALTAAGETLSAMGSLQGVMLVDWLEQQRPVCKATEQEMVRARAERGQRGRDERRNEAARRAMEIAQRENALAKRDTNSDERWESALLAEAERRRELALAVKQKRGLLERGWRSLLASLAAQRGPWAPIPEEEPHWIVHRAESASESWLRVLRKPNKKFNQHDGCARGVDASSAAAAAPPPSAQPIFSMTFVRADTAGDDEEEIEEEQQQQQQQQQQQGDGHARLVRLGKTTDGVLELSRTHVVFGNKAWPLDQLVEVRGLRHLARRVALELEFVGGKTRLLAFDTERDAQLFYRSLLGVRPRKLNPHHFSTVLRRKRPPSISSRLGATKVTERWLSGHLSNFEYLMQLNKMAGRTYNNLSSYPIMPWVLSDWTSQHLDLSNPSVYRDLSLPVGALNPARRAALKRRFDDSSEGAAAFHHGSHYSSPGVVLYWMLRQEPFTTLHLELQGGRFDHPDRLFHSLPEAWNGVWNNAQDVKEMVPELFYDASFLRNSNRFVFGNMQNGEAVDDVVLPPWAESPEHFVALHRAALESDFVSQHLHKWIDLVFGCAQQGPRAVESLNVFFWTTYPDGIDWARLDADPMARAALLSQIENFGQCPDVVFAQQPHPPRRRSVALLHQPSSTGGVLASFLFGSSAIRLTPEKIAVAADGGRVVVVFAGGRYAVCQLSLSPLSWQSDRHLNGPNKERSELPVRVLPGDGRAGRISMAESGGGAVAVFVAGNWNSAWQAVQISSDGSVSGAVQGADLHLGEVLCIARSGSVLVTGSRDTTALVWEPFNGGASAGIPARGCGHEGAVTCVAVCAETHCCATGSDDGTVILRETSGSARLLRSFNLQEQALLLALSPLGPLFVATATRLLMLVPSAPAPVLLCHLPIAPIALEVRGAVLVVATRDRVTIWRDGAPQREIVSPHEVSACCFSGPSLILAAHPNGLVSLIDVGCV